MRAAKWSLSSGREGWAGGACRPAPVSSPTSRSRMSDVQGGGGGLRSAGIQEPLRIFATTCPSQVLSPEGLGLLFKIDILKPDRTQVSPA